MTGPAGQGESGETSQPQSDTGPSYCSVCGRPAEAKIRRGTEVFCSEAHADEFAREVAALRASAEARR